MEDGQIAALSEQASKASVDHPHDKSSGGHKIILRSRHGKKIQDR